jgi:hypothetical protein
MMPMSWTSRPSPTADGEGGGGGQEGPAFNAVERKEPRYVTKEKQLERLRNQMDTKRGSGRA